MEIFIISVFLNDETGTRKMFRNFCPRIGPSVKFFGEEAKETSQTRLLCVLRRPPYREISKTELGVTVYTVGV